MMYFKRLAPLGLAVSLMMGWSSFSFANANDVLPYCSTYNPHTPGPSVSEPLFLARSTGNFIPQWCNAYNLSMGKAWADNAKEVLLNANKKYSVVKFTLVRLPLESDFNLRKFSRCTISVKGPSSWKLGKCKSISDKEGLAYINQFYPGTPYK